jgi:hypothetical protein
LSRSSLRIDGSWFSGLMSDAFFNNSIPLIRLLKLIPRTRTEQPSATLVTPRRLLHICRVIIPRGIASTKALNRHSVHCESLPRCYHHCISLVRTRCLRLAYTSFRCLESTSNVSRLQLTHLGFPVMK